MIEVVAADVEDAVETGAVVFESELGAQLEELFFGEFVAQTGVEFVGDVGRRVSHRVGEFDHQALDFGEHGEVVSGWIMTCSAVVYTCAVCTCAVASTEFHYRQELLIR